jgi:predicted MPP superfamily phosphohydrolase
MSFLLFYVIWVSVVGLGYGYVGRRLIKPSKLKGMKRAFAWGTVVALFLMPQAMFLSFFSRTESFWTDALSWPAYISLGFFSLVLALVVLRDSVLGGKAVVQRVKTLLDKIRKVPPVVVDGSDMERRRFLVHSTNFGIISLSGALAGYGFHEAHHRAAEIEEITVPIASLPMEYEGFRIVQFTDIHVGPTIKRKFVERVVAQVDNLHADLLAFTGDLVDGSVPWLRDEVAPLKDLIAPYGKFFITGNHEYYSGAAPWIEEAGRLGFTVLLNEHRLIQRNNARIVLAGVTDYSAGDFIKSQVSDPAAAIARAPVGLVRILLAHQPKSIFAAARAGYVLQLSGHTHGGQFFPWDYLGRLNQPYIKGLHKHDNTWIYVSRGTGYWGPPLRLGIPPEITVIRLTAQPLR